jgi:hypothetical protein
MRFYEQVYQALGFPHTALQVALGEIRLRPGVSAPFISDGFPPALIPLWSDDFGYYGFWKHWFCDRSISVVRLETGEHFLATEVAKTFDQFVILMTLQMVCSGVFTEEQARSLLHQVSITDADFEAMMEIAKSTGDDPAGLINHPRFKPNPPLASCVATSEYLGDFPIPDEVLKYARRDVCGFELPLAVLQQLRDHEDAPWLSPPGGYRQQRLIFKECREEGNLAGAWLSLNSPAWAPDDARTAIHQLVEWADDETFTVLASAWASERQGVLA